MVHPREMELQYLLFDFTDDEAGACSFDSLASVLPARLPVLLHEIEAVLAWAHREFGAPTTAADDGDWNFELQADGEDDVPMDINYDIERARVSMPAASGRVTLALTITGSRAFGAAFKDAFPDSD